MRVYIACLCALLATACGAPSAPETPPTAQALSSGITISDGWASPTPGGVDVSAGYLVIANGGAAEDALIAVSSPRAERVEVHEMAMDDGVMRMRPVARVLAAPGAEVALAPGGAHLMFYGVTQPFTLGEAIPVQLTFEQAGLISVELSVRAPASNAHSGH